MSERYRKVRPYLRLLVFVAGVLVVVAVFVRRGPDDAAPPQQRTLTPATGTTPTGAARLREARSLLDPRATGVTDEQVECVARDVVDNPAREQIASNMARIQNKDLQQSIMAIYLNCAYDFVLNTYMQFAPQNLDATQRACVRATYTKLDLQRLAEVMVVDPDAGQTGPLVIQACSGHGDGRDPFEQIPALPPPDTGVVVTTRPS